MEFLSYQNRFPSEPSVLHRKNEPSYRLPDYSSLSSSVGGGEIVVNAIDGLEAGFSGHENTLVITHHDTPGMIASISGELAAANLNIATMRVFRRSVGGDAMVALELDGSADTELIARLREAGAKRVTLTAPVDTVIDTTELPKCTGATATYGGLEDD